jgi:heptosyltransferase-3
MNAPPRRVLVIATRRIGDVLLATPVIRSLKRAWPDSDIDALVFNSTAPVLAANPDVHALRVIPERPTLLQHIDFIQKLFRRYDLALSLVPGDRPTLYAWFAGRRRIGVLIDTPKERWKQRLLHQWVAYDHQSRHTLLNHLAVLQPLGVAPLAEVTPAWRELDTQRAAEVLAPLNHARYVVLHLYPKFNYKKWSDAGWLALARWLDAQGLRIVLTGSNDSDELDYIHRLARDMPNPLLLAGQLSLNETACVIRGAAGYVGPDTALTHVAAALGVPTVALFGPTDPLQWGPWPRGHNATTAPWRRLGDQTLGNVRIVQGGGACVPCHHEGCQRHVASFSDCLLSLPADRVINALRDAAQLS